MTRRPFVIFLALTAVSIIAQEPEWDMSEVTEALARGEISKAIFVLEEQRRATEGFPDALESMLGSLYLREGQPERAVELLEPLTTSSEDPALLYNAGRALIEVGRREEGKRMLERSVAANPVSPAARMLGFLRIREGDTRRAYPLLRDWAGVTNDDREAVAAAAWIGLQLGRTSEVSSLLAEVDRRDPRVALLQARLSLEEGDPEQTLRILSEIGSIAELPVELSRDLAWLAAAAYLETGQLSKGRELVANLSPLSTREHWIRAALVGAPEDLGTEMLEKIRISPVEEIPIEDREDLSRLMVIAASTLSGDERQQVLRYAETLAPWRGEGAANQQIESAFHLDSGSDTDRWLSRAERHLARGEPGLALQLASYETMISGDIRAGFMQVQALLGSGELDRAIELADELTRVAPESADAAYQKGLVQLIRNDLESAEASLQRAIEIAPDHVAAMNDLATLLSGQGRGDEAREVAERVLLIDPDNVRARQLLDEQS